MNSEKWSIRSYLTSGTGLGSVGFLQTFGRGSDLVLWVPKFPSALIFECPLSVFKSMFCAWMSNHMQLEQNFTHKNMFHIKRNKYEKKKMVEKNLRSLILKQHQSADLKSFWNWFGFSDWSKDFTKNFALCVGNFIRNFRLALIILTLPLNKKLSS